MEKVSKDLMLETIALAKKCIEFYRNQAENEDEKQTAEAARIVFNDVLTKSFIVAASGNPCPCCGGSGRA